MKENFLMIEQYKEGALYIVYYQQRVSKNAIFWQIVPSTDEIYQ